MAYGRMERGARLQGAQIIALLYSALFFFLISSGYYLLFQRVILVAVIAAILFPLLAWWIARYIGSSEGGISAHKPLFVLLLLISALGVFNSLMLNLEGRRIFVETIDDSHDRFDQLGNRALQELGKGGSDSPLAHMRRVESLKAALFSEIRNPLNCGQGPEARKILASLEEELPEFRPLSNPHPDCAQNDRVIEDYETRINGLVDRAPWSNQALLGIVTDSNAAKKELDQLGATAGESWAVTLLHEVAPRLEAKNSQYRELYERLPKDSDAATGLPARLNLQSVESLGEWSQLVYLLINRWDRPTTYVYLLLAGFADWMMVYLFSLIRVNRGRRIESGALGTPVSRGFN